MNDSTSERLSRRFMLTGTTALVLGSALSATSAQAAPSYSGVRKLPLEVARLDTQITRLGKKPYEAIDVVVDGDRMRLFVPHAAPPGKTVSVGAVWFYHANGSTHTSLSGAYKYGAELAVDRGAVCVCPDFGGTQWTNDIAIARQKRASVYMTNLWKIGRSFMRANSGGGPLMCYAYANGLVPAARGMYLVNGAYDMDDLYRRDPVRIGPPYGNSAAAVAATNPARSTESAWAGTRIKAVASLADPLVPPAEHGLALIAKAKPVAVEALVQYHDEGHVVPGWTHTDMINTFARWA